MMKHEEVAYILPVFAQTQKRRKRFFIADKYEETATAGSGAKSGKQKKKKKTFGPFLPW